MGYTKRQIINAALEELGLDAFDQDTFSSNDFTKKQVIDYALDKLGMQCFNDEDVMNSYTKRELVKAAYEEIGLNPEEFDITPEENQKAGRMLETMLNQWLRDGVECNYSFASDGYHVDLSVDSELSHYAVQAIVLNLSVRLGPTFGRQINPETKENALNSYSVLASRSVSVEFQNKCLDQLDSLMAKWFRSGVDFGYNLPTDATNSALADQSGLYNWGREATYLALATKIAPIFGREAPSNLLTEANNAYETAKLKSISTNYINKCARRLEALIGRLDGENIPLSYAATSDPDSINIDVDSGIPDWSYECVYLNLAVQIAPVFQMVPPVDTKKNAKYAKNVARSNTFTLSERQYRDTLPVGAGNKPWQGHRDNYFSETDYLSEVNT